MTHPPLSPEHLEALQIFARAHTHNWKQELNRAWVTGNYPEASRLPELQQIRNTYGPTWLTRFRLPADTFPRRRKHPAH